MHGKETEVPMMHGWSQNPSILYKTDRLWSEPLHHAERPLPLPHSPTPTLPHFTSRPPTGTFLSLREKLPLVPAAAGSSTRCPNVWPAAVTSSPLVMAASGPGAGRERVN